MCGPRLESVGWAGKKENGPGPGRIIPLLDLFEYFKKTCIDPIQMCPF
jgi:hypothetical protein